MKREKRGYKLNNKGMSLIEVMVAIIILALVTAPLLNSFVSAAKYNTRSKERQRVTSAAQSIMEGFKAYSMEQICCQFNRLSSFLIYSGVDFAGSGTVWESAIVDKDGDGTPDVSVKNVGGVNVFTPSAAGNYMFGMKSISFDGKLYDALITVQQNASSGSSTNLINPEEINGYLDAVYKQASPSDASANTDIKAYSDILTQVLDKVNLMDLNYVYELSDILTDKITIHKTTTVEIKKDPVNDAIKTVTVQYSYDYNVTDYPYYNALNLPDTFDFTFPTITQPTITVYDNTSTVGDGANLGNVYLYYYPAYNNSATGVPIASEKILIKNQTGEERKVYLIKQKRQTDYTFTPGIYNNCENIYAPTIIGSGSAIDLHHNLDTNLSGIGSTTGPESFSGSITPNTEILPEETRILIHDVTIAIYESGEADSGFTGTPIMELNGSMIDK